MSSLEQLAAEVRHLTAKIPREAGSARETQAPKPNKGVWTDEQREHLRVAIRRAREARDNPALREERRRRTTAKIKGIVGTLSCGFTFTELCDASSRDKQLSKARWQVTWALIGKGFSPSDIALAFGSSVQAVHARLK